MFRVAAAALALVGLLVPAVSAAADVVVKEPWARASAGQVRSGAVFLTVENAGRQDDRLIGARTDRARAAEIHEHAHVDGVMRMRRVEEVVVPAGSRVVFEPGGNHVMLIDLGQPLEEGDTLTVTLVFERAGEVAVTTPVLAAGASGPAPAGGGNTGGHSHQHGQLESGSWKAPPHWATCDCGGGMPEFSPQ